ncbi:MAG: hypothetical protein JW982_00450 [Spirochaetes bacterium]|nr:hypothetical protein [Spirochaetota bacterium]
MILKKYLLYSACLFGIVLLFSMCSGCKSGNGSIEYKNRIYSNGDEIEVIGRISRVGNEPFTHLVLIDDSGARFSIVKESEEPFLKFKGNQFKITGTLYLKKLVTADGNKTSTIIEISPVSIIPLE